MNAKKAIVERWKQFGKNTSMRALPKQAEQLIARTSKTASRILVIANAQADRGDHEIAIETLRTGLTRFPGNLDLEYRIAFLLEKSGSLNDAKEIYLRQASNPRANRQAPYRLAVTLHRLGQVDEALSWVLNYCSRHPHDARANQLAYKLASNEPLWRRYEILSSAASRLEADAEWQTKTIALAYNMKRFEDCISRYRIIAGRAKRRTVAQVVASLMHLDRIDDAWKTATEYLNRSNFDGNQKFPGTLMQELGAWNFAQILHETSYQKSPNSQLAYLVGFACSRTFEWKNAADWYRAALPGSKNEKRIRYDLGVALERQELWLDAAREYLKAASSNSASDYRIYRAISCISAAKNFDAAASLLSRLEWDSHPPEQSIDPDFAVPLNPSNELDRLFREALETQRTTAIEHVALEGVSLRQWDLAIKASSALVERSWSHRQQDHLLKARALAGGGDLDGAVKAFLESRLYRDATIIGHDHYEKTRLTKLSMRYGTFFQNDEVDAEAVLYESNHGGKLTCNVLPLVRALVDDPRFEGHNHYVVVPDRTFLPEDLISRANVIAVPRESDLYLRKLATSGWLVNNNTFPSYFVRRPEQKYLNLWHGTPIKSMGNEIKNGNFDYRNATRNLLHVTHLALPNDHTRQQLLECYGVSQLHRAQVALTGSPRLDTTLNLPVIRRESLRSHLGLGAEEKVVLYAPTWRGELGQVETDGEMVTQVISKIEESGYRALYRGHPVSGSYPADDHVKSLTVPDEIDTNELLACVDAVVSDYSSIVFDAAIAGVPVSLLAYDERQFEDDRGFSLDIRAIGMPVLQDLDAFSRWLDGLGSAQRIRLPDSLVESEDGTATERVVEFMMKTSPKRSEQAKKSTILLFEGHFIPNGITSSARELNSVLRDLGAKVAVAVEPGAITPHEDRTEAFKESTHGCDVLPRIAGALDTPEERWLIGRQHQGHFMSKEQLSIVHQAFKREFRRLYGATEFDVVVGFEGFSLYWENLMSAAPSARKIAYLHANMVQEASTRFPYLWSVFDSYRWFDVLASVSPDATSVNSQSLSPWTEVQRFVTVENLIDVEDIKKNADSRCSDDFIEFTSRFSKNFVSVGRISIEKGSDRLVDAFLEVAEENDDVGLVIIGDGPLRLELESRVQLAGFSDRVFFTGQLRSPFGHMKHCDALVMASRHEGQGIVVLEAFVLGLNVVSVDIPGPGSLLRDGAGMLVENSPDGLVAGMHRILNGYAPDKEFDVEAYVESAKDHAIKAMFGA
jgi:CDP-glycerol glycerophosphotransferase